MTSAVPHLRQADLSRAAGAAPQQVRTAVAQASRATGVDFAYLMEKASVESGFRTDVRASTSSATGLFQFIDSTWLEMVKEHGAKHGLGAYAEMIERGPNGRATVKDPMDRREILELRKDPRLSALLAGELANDNRRHLEGELGRPVNRTDLYMAHFLGANGAAKFLMAMEANPAQRADTLLPEAARANRGVFFTNGRPATLSDIYSRFAAKFGEEGVGDAMGPFGRVIAAPGNDGNPVHSGRSAASAVEPLSTFTVLLLNQLAPPDGGDGNKDPSRQGEDRRLTPNPLGRVSL